MGSSDSPDVHTRESRAEDAPSSSITATPEQNATEGFLLTGRRIVDINHFIQQLQFLNQHSPIGCSLTEMRVIAETRKGLNSSIKFKCLMCNLEKVVWTNDPKKSSASVNTAAVIGSIGIGIGHSNMEEFFSTLDVPSLTSSTYDVEHEKVSNAWEECASLEMQQAVQVEKELALQRGDVDAEGVPLLTVIVDGTWSKRSYRTNYSSLSGAVSTFLKYYC